MSSARQSSLRRWPFWLLIAAWFCANTPQVAVLHAILWAKGATHFSHQARLTQSVAALLNGQPEAESPELLAATEAAQRTTTPVLPPDALVKKLVLFAGAVSHLVWRPLDSRSHVQPDAFRPAEHVADVPHPPPRGVIV